MTSEISSSRTLRRTILELRVRRIPTGFRPKAQGCAERATLGHRPNKYLNRNAVAAIPAIPSRTILPQPRLRLLESFDS